MKSLAKKFQTLCGRSYRNKFRAMLKGYRTLRMQNRLSLIEDLHKDLRGASFGLQNANYSTTIFGAASPSAELVVRQVLAMREHSINSALLVALGGGRKRIILPLPYKWLKIIEAYGFQVNFFISAVLLIASGIKRILTSFVGLVKDLSKELLHQFQGRQRSEPFVYFCDLVETNLPQPNGSVNSCCIINWYRNWSGRPERIKLICHGVETYKNVKISGLNLVYRETPFPFFTTFIAFYRYLTWYFRASILCIIDLMRGRWWHCTVLPDALLAAKVRFADKTTLAEKYFFHNSRPYPPLWSYELPKSRSEVVFYWYSANIEPFERNDGSRPLTTPYSLMNWPRHLVWDERHADFVTRCSERSTNVQIVGPIWFQDSGENLPNIPRPRIAIFDVQPVRNSLYCCLGHSKEFYTAVVLTKFYQDIVDVFYKKKISILIKRKRKIGNLVHPTYDRLIKNLVHTNVVEEIDSEISAYRLIDYVDGIISLPFTSTALYAKQIGKPSIYYDPTGTLFVGDPSAHGVRILNTREQLCQWYMAIENRKVNLAAH